MSDHCRAHTEAQSRLLACEGLCPPNSRGIFDSMRGSLRTFSLIALTWFTVSLLLTRGWWWLFAIAMHGDYARAERFPPRVLEVIDFLAGVGFAMSWPILDHLSAPCWGICGVAEEFYLIRAYAVNAVLWSIVVTIALLVLRRHWPKTAD